MSGAFYKLFQKCLFTFVRNIAITTGQLTPINMYKSTMGDSVSLDRAESSLSGPSMRDDCTPIKIAALMYFICQNAARMPFMPGISFVFHFAGVGLVKGISLAGGMILSDSKRDGKSI
jgi:hypothetical protein